jgi:hypothetical protein
VGEGRKRWAGPASVVVSAVTGIIINMITSTWTWALAAALVVLVLLGGFLTTMGGTIGSTRVRQRADRGGTIQRSPIRARGGAEAAQHADRKGTIHDSGIDAG